MTTVKDNTPDEPLSDVTPDHSSSSAADRSQHETASAMSHASVHDHPDLGTVSSGNKQAHMVEPDIDAIEMDSSVDSLSDSAATLEELDHLLNDVENFDDEEADASFGLAGFTSDQTDDLNISVLDELKALVDEITYQRQDPNNDGRSDCEYEQASFNQGPVVDELRSLLQSSVDYLGTATDDDLDPATISAMEHPSRAVLKNQLSTALERLCSLYDGSVEPDAEVSAAYLDELSAMLENADLSYTSLHLRGNGISSEINEAAMDTDYQSPVELANQEFSEDAELDTDALIAEMNELLQESGIDDGDDDISYDGTDMDLDISYAAAMPESDDALLQHETEIPDSEMEHDRLPVADNETADESISNLFEPHTAETPTHTITDIVAQSEDDENEAIPAPAAVDALERLEAMANMSADAEGIEHSIPDAEHDQDAVVQQPATTQTESDEQDWDEDDYERLDDDNVVVIRKNSSAWNDSVDSEQPSLTKTGMTRSKLAVVSLVACIAIAAVVYWSLTDRDGQRVEHPSATLADPATTAMPEQSPSQQWRQAGRSNEAQAVQTAVESDRNDLVAETVVNDSAAPAPQRRSVTADNPAVSEAVENQPQPLQDRQAHVAANHELDVKDHIAALASMNSDYFIEEAVDTGDSTSHSVPDNADPMPDQVAASHRHNSADTLDQAHIHDLAGASAETVQPEQPTVDNISTEGRYVWFVHIASYYGEPPSEKELEYLDHADVPYEIRSAVIDGATWYRVLVSNFTAYQDAKDYSETLKTSLRTSKIWISKRRI